MNEPITKLAVSVANDLEQAIMRAGWHTGSLFATEAELIERYSYSRAIIREAISQLERRGIVSRRRGNGGGLIVSAHARDAAVAAIADYLEFSDVSGDDVLEARACLETQAAALAAERIDDAHLQKLRTCAQKLKRQTGEVEEDTKSHIEFRETIAQSTSNDLLALFIEALNFPIFELGVVYAAKTPVFYEIMKQTTPVKQRLADAIGRCDRLAARELAQEDAELQIAGYKRLRARSRRVSTLGKRTSQQKLAHILALQLSQDIKAAKILPGQRFGSEMELMAKYQVGRPVFREAIRHLEAHSIVRTQRGSGGGLLAATPSSSYSAKIASRYINHMVLPKSAILEVREPLGLAAVRFAVPRLTRQSARRIQDSLDSFAAASEPKDLLMKSMAIHYAICKASNNRVISLLMQIVLQALTNVAFGWSELLVDKVRGIAESHKAIAEAVLNRDEGAAARNMLRHLSVLKDSWYVDQKNYGLPDETHFPDYSQVFGET